MIGATRGTAQRDAKGLRWERRRLAKMREGNPRREYERNHRRKRPTSLAARMGLVEPLGCGVGRERLCDLGVAGRRRGGRDPDFRARVDLRRTRGMERPGHFGRREQFFSRARQTPPAPHRPAASSMARPGTHRARGRRARRCETCRHDERDALGHQPRALLGEMPLQPEIAFLARRRSDGDERHEQRARGDLLAALSIPRIAADEAALPGRATPPGRPGAAPRRCAPSPPRLATRSWGRRLGRRIRTSRGGLSGGNRKRGHTEKSHVALASAVLRADWAAPFCKPHSDARARRRHASD